MEQQLPQFGLSVHHDDDVAVLHLRGELDLDAAGHLRSVVEVLLDQGVTRVQIAAEDLTFVDSSGFKTLLDLRHGASERDAVVEVVSASDRLRWVVRVTGVDGLLPAGG